MKIAIDALPLMLPKTGIGFYTGHLLSEFVRTAPENEYYLCDMLLGQSFYNLIKIKDLAKSLKTLQNISRFSYPLQPMIRIGLMVYSRGSQETKKIEEMDLFFGPNFKGFFKGNLKNVITIHDMGHEFYPENVEEKVLDYLREELPRAAKLANLIIADSKSTKRDILKFLNVPEEKVKVISIGVDKSFQPIKDPMVLETTRKKYRLSEDFILYLGAIQPRKNITGLIQAYNLLSKRQGFNYDLVIGGGVGWRNENVSRLVVELGLENRIRFTGYIEPLDLPVLYNLATTFVYPSFYEGFGLPVLEAMACGVPVVTSNVSSLPEIAGDAAVYVNPHSVEELSEGIRRILFDGNLRSSCVIKGLERARSFTWEGCARETLKTFNQALRDSILSG